MFERMNIKDGGKGLVRGRDRGSREGSLCKADAIFTKSPLAEVYVLPFPLTVRSHPFPFRIFFALLIFDRLFYSFFFCLAQELPTARGTPAEGTTQRPLATMEPVVVASVAELQSTPCTTITTRTTSRTVPLRIHRKRPPPTTIIRWDGTSPTKTSPPLPPGTRIITREYL